MVKKIKYYGVFVKRTIGDELPKELIDMANMLSKHGEIKGLGKTITRVQVFDNELEQINCALTVKGTVTVIETIDAVDKADLMSQVEQLKEKYPDEEEEPIDDCPSCHEFPD